MKIKYRVILVLAVKHGILKQACFQHFRDTVNQINSLDYQEELALKQAICLVLKIKKKNIDYSQYNQMLFGFSQDVLVFYTENTYIGVGLGGYIKTRDEFEKDVTRPRVNSIFVFGVNAFL